MAVLSQVFNEEALGRASAQVVANGNRQNQDSFPPLGLDSSRGTQAMPTKEKETFLTTQSI